jgi:hypothetical protein
MSNYFSILISYIYKIVSSFSVNSDTSYFFISDIYFFSSTFTGLLVFLFKVETDPVFGFTTAFVAVFVNPVPALTVETFVAFTSDLPPIFLVAEPIFVGLTVSIFLFDYVGFDGGFIPFVALLDLISGELIFFYSIFYVAFLAVSVFSEVCCFTTGFFSIFEGFCGFLGFI